MTARFTLAIPTHGRRETLLLAVESARRQTRPPERILVLCDGDPDGTADAVRALGDPLVEAVVLPKGPGYAYTHRNVPLERPGADVVLWLADDDLLLPDHLEQLGEVWDAADPALVMVTAPAVIVHEDDRLEWLGRDWSIAANRAALLGRENHCPMASVSVRADAARAAGGWTGDQPRAGDWELWKRMLGPPLARVAMVADPTVLHFRAALRAQSWPDRVEQNTRWLARIHDPEQRVRIRAAMRRAHAEREAADYGQVLTLIAATQDQAAAIAAERVAFRQQAATLQGRAAGLQTIMDALSAELAQLRDERAALHAEVDAVRLDGAAGHRRADEHLAAYRHAAAARDHHAEVLAAIYQGRWWRLRTVIRRAAGFWRRAGT